MSIEQRLVRLEEIVIIVTAALRYSNPWAFTSLSPEEVERLKTLLEDMAADDLQRRR